jgi:AcrR family transcriptional regulator
MATPKPALRDVVSSVLKKSKRVVKPAAERRHEILEAALALFGEKGFHETTVDDIASAAGVAKGTIYLYFPRSSKENILIALKREFHDGLHARVADVIADATERLSAGDRLDYRDVIDDIFDAMVAYNVEHKDAVEVVVRQTPGPDLVQEALDLEKEIVLLIASAFRQAKQAGLIHTTDPEMMAYLVTASIRDNLVTCLCYDEPSSLERFVAAAKELLYKALAPDVAFLPRLPRGRGD